MKTVWIDDTTGFEYDDYNKARDAVLEYLNGDDYRNALAEVISKYGISEVLKGFVHPNIGTRLYEEIMDTAEQTVLSMFLVEREVEEDEEDEEI